MISPKELEHLRVTIVMLPIDDEAKRTWLKVLALVSETQSNIVKGTAALKRLQAMNRQAHMVLGVLILLAAANVAIFLSEVL